MKIPFYPLCLKEKQRKLERLENERHRVSSSKKSGEDEKTKLKKEFQDLETVATRLDQEKSNKDHMIKSLNDEIEERDAAIDKVSKL